MSRELGIKIKGKFLGKIEGIYKSTPIIVTPDIPPCHSTNYFITRKIKDDTLIVSHTDDNGSINISEHSVNK